MKTTMKSMLALMAGTMMFAACSNDDVTENINEQKTSELKPMTFTATMEAKDGTSRAFIDGLAIKWETGDKISIFDGATENSGNQEFTLKGDGGSSTGTFTGEAAEAEIYCALYPYTAGVTMNEGTLTGVVLPAEQTATAGTADKNAILMYATSEDANTLQFMNFCAYVKVTPQFDCTSIVLESNGEENLAGTLKVSMNGYGKPTTTVTANGSNTVTLTGTISANNTYYIAVRPEKLASGFTITFTTTDGDYYKSTSNEVSFTRNNVTNLGSFATSDLTIPTTGTTGKAYATGPNCDVNWVQLWEGGPRFAEYNVGASNATEAGTTMSLADVARTGDDYVWGANWRTPSKDELDELLKAATSEGSKKVTCTLVRENDEETGNIIGFKFTGKETSYTGNSVFFPNMYIDNDYCTVYFWTSSAYSDNELWAVVLEYSVSVWESRWRNGRSINEFHVRPVLAK